MSTPDFPFIPLELVEHLEKIITDCVPRLEDSEREIFHHVGAVHVVRLLRMQYEAQNETEQMEH
jgi:hypothetical protein|tara:strand:- start:2586 stop:2777 length:192 start_codon:yes stop_codon:yes gene_type:complete